MAARHGITHIEPAGGGHVPTHYLDPNALAADADALAAWRDTLDSRGLTIAALGVYGNPLHPAPATAQAAQRDFAAMCSVAEQLGVQRVTVISGVPGGGPDDRVPNWIVNSIFPEFSAAYRWQWEARLIPYWRQACAIAADHGVTICMEPHAGSMIYNGETFLRLQEACGEHLRLSFDASHLWWQGIDPIAAVEQLGEFITYVQVKDVSFNPRRVARDGVVPSCEYDDWRVRPWVYRAVGLGHGEQFWKGLFTALRVHGYDGVVAIEYEEPFLSIDEAIGQSVAMVSRALPRDPIPDRNWFEGYEWPTASPE